MDEVDTWSAARRRRARRESSSRVVLVGAVVVLGLGVMVVALVLSGDDEAPARAATVKAPKREREREPAKPKPTGPCDGLRKLAEDDGGDIMFHRCEKDDWSTDAVACFAIQPTDITGCMPKLTKEQSQRLERDIAEEVARRLPRPKAPTWSRPADPACTAALEHAVQIGIAGADPKDTSRELVEMVKKRAPAIMDAMAHVCTEDAWPAATVRCFSTIATEREYMACDKQLSPDQRKRAQEALGNALLAR